MKKGLILLLLVVLSGCSSENLEPYQNEKESCEGKKIMFDFPPVNLEKTELLLPLGLMTDGHVTPVDHQYFQNFANDEVDIEVYSPGDGRVIALEHMPGAAPGEDYRVIIDHTCTISSIYIHIDILAEKLRKHISDDDRYIRVNIPVEAGEVIGYYKNNVDYNLVDEEVILPGLLVADHYATEPWKIHVPETLKYFNEPIKSKLLDLSVRTVEPISGKLDYDIDGKLIGNWFREDTNWYAGQAELDSYWIGHLSISPDYLDPNHIIVSMGDYGGEEKQFGVRGNTPNPAEVDVSTGRIKYELVDYDYYTTEGKIWDRGSLVKIKNAENTIQTRGVAIFQLIEPRKLKAEFFPDKQLGEITTFTDSARIYER